jgi:hypothetical protein
MNRANDGFAAGMKPHYFGVQRIPCLGGPRLLLGLSLQVVKMRACTEMLPDRGEHNGAALRLIMAFFQQRYVNSKRLSGN